MNKKISLGAALAFMIVVAGITFCITMVVSLNHFNTMVLNVKSREEMFKKLADVDREARQNFDGTIDEEILADSLSAGYIKGLGDKFSTYLSKNQYEQKLKDMSGKEVGIGVIGAKDESGYYKVKKVIAGSAAEKYNLQVEDYIVSLSEVDTKTISAESIERLMRGEVGSKLGLVIRRDGVDEAREIVRADLTIPTVEVRMADTTAIAKFSAIDERTYSQFKDLIDKAISDGATGLVLDFRDCDGTSLTSARSIMNLVLPSGELGTLVDNNGNKTSIGNSDRYELSLPIAMVVNAKTSGLSELIAATLREYNKANCIGVTTAGKGSIQSLIQLTDGSAINITTSHFFPPSGEEINGVGVKPEYEVKMTAEQELLIGEFSTEYDPQLQKALEIINSKTNQETAE